MKTFVKLTLLSLFLLAASACGTDEQTAGTDAETDDSAEAGEAANEASSDEETYTVATDNGFVPFEFVDEETGDLVGFDIDLITAISDEAGFAIEFETMDFDAIVAGVSSGRYDIGIAGMTITEERKENIDFSQPYYTSGLTVAVHVDNDEITSIDDLDGKNVTTRTGSTSERYLEQNTDAVIEAFPQITEAYQNVITGRADATVYDIPNVQYYASTEGGEQLKVVGDPLTGEDYGIAFSKGSEIRNVADEALTTLMENGTFGDIYEKWFGERPDGM